MKFTLFLNVFSHSEKSERDEVDEILVKEPQVCLSAS